MIKLLMTTYRSVKGNTKHDILNACLESEAIEKVRKELYDSLSQGFSPLPRGTKDERHLSGSYVGSCDPDGTILVTEPIPQCVLALVKEAASDGDLEELEGFRVLYYVGFRNTSTVIPPPEDDVIARVLFNVGNNEIYHFEAAERRLEDLNTEFKNKLGDIPASLRMDNRDIFIPKDSYRCLSYKSLCDYKITVSSTPPKSTPPSMEANGRSVLPRRFMRPPSYHRITIVVDLLATKRAISKIDKAVHTTVQKIDISKIQKTAALIGEKIRNGTDDKSDEPEKINLTKEEKKAIKNLM